jgi:hypothetical protein
MSDSSSPREALVTRWLRWLGVCALASGIAVLTSSTASASCGHYVKRLGPGFVPVQAAVKRLARETHSVTVPCGCQGSECRRAPQDSVPLNPQAPVRQFTQQDLVAIAVHDALAGPHVAALYGSSAAHVSSGYPSRLNRPPAA